MSRQYILASSSPRRIEMMKAHGMHPIIMPSHADEHLPLHSGMTETPMFLAFQKAKAVEEQYLQQHSGEIAGQTPAPIIIAADTIVYKDRIMGKPLDRNDALRMLMELRGDMHYVVTGAALVEAGRSRAKVFCQLTKVFFKDFTAEELSAYLSTDEPYDKAGAYAIQGYFSRYIDHIEGDYDNVVGFPWQRIEQELKDFLSAQP